MEEQKRIDSPGIAALILGIASIVLAFFVPFIALLCAIVGLVMCHVSKTHFGANGFQRGGKVCAIIGIVLVAVVVLLMILLLGAMIGAALTTGAVTAI